MSATQGSYQVRFDWGVDGARLVGTDADVIVWVDQLAEPAQLADGTAPAAPEALDVDTACAVVAGELQSSAAIADWCLRRQEQLGGRFRIAVVAAGAPRGDGALRFAVEDLLAAGAIIDAIAELGIDHQSPEAAAAAAAYTGLRRATKHLVSASVSARELGGVQLDLEPVPHVRILRESSLA